MKKFRKLIPALALLLVSAVLMSTASYAWFSMNNKVTVTGMEVKTKVSSNLLIAKSEIDETDKEDEGDFKTYLVDQVKGILEPVSTPNAENFFYTTDANNDGSYSKVGSEAFLAYDPSAAGSAGYADLFSQHYGVTTSTANGMIDDTVDGAVAYVDYVFQLKASSTVAGASKEYINLTKLDLIYNKGSEPADESYAHRVAIFVEKFNSNFSDHAAGSSGTYAASSSANFDAPTASNAVVATATTYQEANYVSTTAALAEVGGGNTEYFKVVVRIWLEGQDTTCNNDTFMKLTNDWTLEIELVLNDQANGSVQYITKSNA